MRACVCACAVLLHCSSPLYSTVPCTYVWHVRTYPYSGCVKRVPSLWVYVCMCPSQMVSFIAKYLCTCLTALQTYTTLMYVHTRTHKHTHVCTYILQYSTAQLHVTNIPNSGCGAMCHKKCETKMPNLCGISQKMLAEAVKGVNEEKKRRRSVSSQFLCLFPSSVLWCTS